MPVTSRAVVEFVLLGPTHDRRQLQDSPILGDVWAEFASNPGAAVDLLISPNRTEPAGPVATALARRLRAMEIAPHPPGKEAHVAYLQSIIAARLFFAELLRVVVPMTVWWRDRKLREELATYVRTDRLRKVIETIIEWAQAGEMTVRDNLAVKFAQFTAIDRYVSLAGLILWAGTVPGSSDKGVGGLIDSLKNGDEIVGLLSDLFEKIVGDPPLDKPLVWQVSLNRRGDAGARAVGAGGEGRRGAGAVQGEVRRHRLGRARFGHRRDASRIPGRRRKIARRSRASTSATFARWSASTTSAWTTSTRRREPSASVEAEERQHRGVGEAAGDLRTLAQDADNDRPINWSVVAKFVEIKGVVEPFGGHGTHVAGIIGADGERANKVGAASGRTDHADGMCPDIKLYDFRVLGADARGHGVRDHRGAAVHPLPQRAPHVHRPFTAPT